MTTEKTAENEEPQRTASGMVLNPKTQRFEAPKAKKATAARKHKAAEKPAKGATAIVGGRAGRWVKLNGKQVHVRYYEEMTREVDGDTFTSPEKSTVVLKNGEPYSAPRDPKK